MKILVANLGSTSFKYRLYDMESETQLARGGIDRIGGSESSCSVEIGDWKEDRTAHVPDHAVAVQQCLSQLTDAEHGCLKSADEVAAIGFKAVHGGRVSGVQRVTRDVLEAMAEMSPVAPAHNPPYINAMRLLGEKLPEIPLVAAFETGFHQTIPDRLRYYAIPKEWSDQYQIKRWGFHGASHRYIGVRSAELLGRDDLRVISCHLGGSSSLCAIRNKQSAATTMGMSPQTGLPQNNRVGDFDAYFLPMLMDKTGKSLEELLAYLGGHGGLLGISGGISGDMRDLENAAAEGSADAKLAIDVYISEIRRYLGGMLVELGGVDAIVFTGGIGENGKQVRADVCANLSELGIELDAAKNDAAKGESAIHADDSKTQIWVIPTNEELIVARQTKQLLES
ncbi:acetate/propionate family kinase [Blastopirellula retiformator]|uniref:Acetate kinase n=1 Tax=Blastopirellula retiformator TaxID=2527970 RepID=A0A5C5UX45_9BACT|nr:acetate/propionate family kinase [Blastopirellula retiformator]TWT30002.1 Acetate kinase [Blastopirellula retiformator]